MVFFRNCLARNPWLPLALILLLAVGVRAVYLHQSRSAPTFENPIIDAATYDERARELVSTGELNEEIFWQAPLYPLFLAGVYALTDGSIGAAHLAGSLLGCVTCLLIALAGRRISGAAVGLVAGVIYALYGPAVFFEAELLSAGMAAFFAALLLWQWIDVRENPGAGRLLLLGVSGALAVLVRATFLPFLAGSAVWLVVDWRRGGASPRLLLRRFVFLLIGGLLVAAPFAEMSRRIVGRPVLLPPSGGINLYLGNNPDFEHTVNARPGREWTRLRALPQQAGVEGDVWEREAWYVDEVRRFVLREPAAALSLLGRKVMHLVGSRELPRNVDLYLMSRWSPLLQTLVGRWGPFGFPFGVLLPFALLGLVARHREAPMPLKIFLALFSLTIVAFFVSARFRLVLVPGLSVMAAAGAVTLVDWIRRRRYRPLIGAAVMTIPLGLAISLPGPFAQERVDLEPELHYALGWNHYQAERWVEAEADLARAVQLRPDFPEAHNYLGIALYRQNRLREAVRHFAESARLDPEFADVRSSLRVVSEEKASCLAEAWRSATAAEPLVRDGARAIFFANRAAALSIEPDPCVTGVRAVAFSATGDGQEAAVLARRSLAMLDEEPVHPCAHEHELRERLTAILDGIPDER